MFLCVCVSGFWLNLFFVVGSDSIKASGCFWFFVVLMRNDFDLDLDLDYLFLFEIWVIDFLIR